jgi:hypothetical protein
VGSFITFFKTTPFVVRFNNNFFHIRVPFSAGRAFSQPLARLVATILAEKTCFGFDHISGFVSKVKIMRILKALQLN